MIIHQPEIIHHNGTAILSARLEVTGNRGHLPPYFWYRMPEQYAQFLTTHSDAFLLPALVSAMIWNQPLEVRGTVSPRLAYHLPEWQHMAVYKLNYVMNPVEIKYDKIAPDTVPPQAVGFTFSGGVDSFFTLYNHLPEKQPSPEYWITHGLFIHGFDIPQRERKKFRLLYKHFRPALQSLNIDLVPVETNLGHAAWPSINNLRMFTYILAGAALGLNGLLKRLIISSTYHYDVNIARKTSTATPEMDRLFSSDTLDVDYYGLEDTRMQKVEKISDWPLAQEYLRVCGVGAEPPLHNCGRCAKCLRTMTTLYSLDRLKDFRTFRHPFQKGSDMLRWGRKLNPKDGYVPSTLKFVQQKSPRLMPWLRTAYVFGWLRYQALRLLPGFVKRWLNRFGKFIPGMYEDPKAFENDEVLGWIKENEN